LPGFWLPETFPEDIRVLVSASEDSSAAAALKHSRLIQLSCNRADDIKASLIDSCPKPLQKLLSSNSNKVSLQYCRIIIQLFSQDNPFYESLEEFDSHALKDFTIAELCRTILEFWQGRLLAKRSIEEIFKVLSLCKKGLTAGEVCSLVNLRPSEFKKFVCVFDGLVGSY